MARMASVAQSSVQPGLSRLDLKEIQDFIYHNGNVHTCRSAALTDDLFNGIPVLFRLMFLILFLKFPRVGTLVADTAFVRNGGFTLYTGLLYTCHLYAILPYTQILLCL